MHSERQWLVSVDDDAWVVAVGEVVVGGWLDV